MDGLSGSLDQMSNSSRIEDFNVKDHYSSVCEEDHIFGSDKSMSVNCRTML